MTMLNETSNSEVKWQAWVAKGHAQDLRTTRRAKLVGLVLAVAGAVALAMALFPR